MNYHINIMIFVRCYGDMLQHVSTLPKTQQLTHRYCVGTLTRHP